MEFITQTQITDRFWSEKREITRRDGLIYQWHALNDQIPDAAPSYCMRNFKAAAGKIKAPHGGCVFQDSDVAKWLEGAAFSLGWHRDAELEALMDSAIEDIVAAQQPDGYMDTYYILNGLDNRWTNLVDHHEMYCAGHMLEAAIAVYQTTGKRKLLDAVIRLVEHIDARFGPEENKLHGYPGHPVLEMALMKLYELTGEQRDLRLAEYLITERGKEPRFFDEEIAQNHLNCYWKRGHLGLAYYQADKPLTEQQDAEGHAVRALYLYAGLADVARESGRSELLDAAHRLWNSVTRKRMYITGGVGSSEYGESFTFDYDLPNDTAYTESCASIALVFFAQRMLRLEPKAEYADVMERALYNGIISGMQLDGKRFFYVNPLEVLPEACQEDEHKRHVKPERQKWFGCACCPPNIIRLLMSLQNYIWSVEGNTLFCHLYVQGRTETRLNGVGFAVETRTDYPWNGKVEMKVEAEKNVQGTLALRVPGWCSHYTLLLNGKKADFALQEGYALLERQWQSGDTIELELDMQVKLYRAHAKVREDAGKLAVVRGPIVYCLEEADNGPDLHLLRLGNPSEKQFDTCWREDLLGGVMTISCKGYREEVSNEDLYSAYEPAKEKETLLHFIPYYAWANRGIGEMCVWIRS